MFHKIENGVCCYTLNAMKEYGICIIILYSRFFCRGYLLIQLGLLYILTFVDNRSTQGLLIISVCS